MEKSYHLLLKDVMTPISAGQMRERTKALNHIIRAEKQKRGRLSFFIYAQTPDVVAIGIRNQNQGMWLFDASSKREVEGLYSEGLPLVENATDMLLKGENATIQEVNSKLPQFLTKYYPNLAKVINKKGQRLPSPKFKKTA